MQGYVLLMNNNVFVRCCGRAGENVTSGPRWWGWLVVPGLDSLVPGVPNSRYFCFFCREQNLYISACVPDTISNQPWLNIHIYRMICGLDGGWSCCCLHVKYTHKICGLATFCYFFFLCMVEVSKVLGCSWLLAGVFISAASTLHLGAFEAGSTLSERPPSIRTYSFEAYVQKNVIRNLRRIRNRI